MSETAVEEIHERRAEGDEILRVEGLVSTSRSAAACSRRSGQVHAVDGVDLTVRAGETLGVVGESGCGSKTTLGRTIMKLTEPTAGKIFFNGRDITGFSRRQMREVRGADRLPGSLRVAQPPDDCARDRGRAAPHQRPLPSGCRARIEELLRTVGPLAGARESLPHEASGGQRQRIGIARSLALNPQLVLDEPVSALDVSICAQVINLLESLQHDFGLTYVFGARPLRRPARVRPRRGYIWGRSSRSGRAIRSTSGRRIRTRGAPLGGADRRPDGARPAAADHPEGRRSEPGQPTLRLPFPYALLEGAGDLRCRVSRPDRPRLRPAERVPLRRADGRAPARHGDERCEPGACHWVAADLGLGPAAGPKQGDDSRRPQVVQHGLDGVPGVEHERPDRPTPGDWPSSTSWIELAAASISFDISARARRGGFARRRGPPGPRRRRSSRRRWRSCPGSCGAA